MYDKRTTGDWFVCCRYVNVLHSYWQAWNATCTYSPYKDKCKWDMLDFSCWIERSCSYCAAIMCRYINVGLFCSLLDCLNTEIHPDFNGVHVQRWPQPLMFEMADCRGKHSTRVVLVYVFLGLIANTTVKMFHFLIIDITKTSLLPRIIGVQDLSEIFSNYFFFFGMN